MDAEESRHAVRVLRMREGDTLHVTNGCGQMFACRIVTADDRACTVEATGSPLVCADLERPKLHLAVAPTKNPARMEWLVEKAVEVGVDEITLLQCDHSERTFLKTDRLERIALSAMKQSLHTMLPVIHPTVSLRDWLSTFHFPLSSQKFIAHCEEGQPRLPIATALKPGVDTTVLIGPEGDFSEEEIAAALTHGFQPVSLGSSRLRTETAALYAVAAFSMINEGLTPTPDTNPYLDATGILSSPRERGVDTAIA